MFKILGCAAMAAAVATLAPPGAHGAIKVGAPAPKFSVVTFDRRHFTSEDLKGKVVILNYWAPWCAPCKAEVLVFDSYVRRHPGTDLKLFSIDYDQTIPDAKLAPLAKLLAYPLVTKMQGSGYGLIKDGLPTSYVIDRSGVIRHAASGAFTDDSFDQLITPLLTASPPS